MTPVLHTTITGHGQPIVLLHGFLSSSHYFHRLRRYLEADFQVITVDLLGFGLSPKPAGDYTYESHVKAIHNTLKHYKISVPVALIGHSTGALIAQRYARVHPDEVRAVVLFNPPLFLSPEQAIRVYLDSPGHYQKLLYSPQKHLYWRLLKSLPRNISRFRPAINLADVLRASRAGREETFTHVISRAELVDDLMATRQPTILIVGKKDRPIYQENLRRLTLPSTTTVQLVDSNHFFSANRPEESAKVIKSHLLQ